MSLSLYEKMFYEAYRIRLVEEKIAEIYSSDKIQSPVHLSIGQEHIPVSFCQGLQKTDLVFGTYRGHALYLAKGGNLNKMMAELYGKKTGCGGGKAGSMHLSEASVGMMGCSAIVATTIPNAVGAALAAKIKKSSQVILVFFGEGSTGNGVYHESLNFAAKHSLPILFVCENNNFSIYTNVDKIHSYQVSTHARSYGIHCQFIEDGYDMIKLKNLADDVIGKIKQGYGPQLLEIKTFRGKQHVGPAYDYDIGYRPNSQMTDWQAVDPLIQDKTLIEKYKEQINLEIEASMIFADSSPDPDLEDLYNHVI
ncbi:MAG: thiamine pyrophosphate-dependent dehydrogenase E1 component subunit alpha [Leptospiraceae bacterium]|nr:thiamine pyrophosphate-dependent dehydrogenase E1 component subunit alpha [Leptospiraceae bacterium]